MSDQSHQQHSGHGGARKYDAICVGGSLANIVIATILAKRGAKVAVIEKLHHLGGKVGATPHRGHWIGWGHRDADSGIGDVGHTMIYRYAAEKAAGVKFPEIENAQGGRDGEDFMLIHHLSDPKRKTELPMTIMQGGMDDEGKGLIALLESVAPDATDPQGAAKELGKALYKLSQMEEDEAWAKVDMPLSDWVHRNVRHPEARRAFFTFLECATAQPGEDASVGRFALSGKWTYGSPHWVDSPKVGGMQALIQPWVEEMEKAGVEIWNGWKPVEILIDEDRDIGSSAGLRGQARGAVAVNESNLVQEFHAPIVISDIYGWRLGELIDEDFLPDEFLRRARGTATKKSEVLGYIGSFTRLPTVRETGDQETNSGWQRIMFGEGMNKRYHMSFHWQSLTDPRCSPEGKHQLMVSGLRVPRNSFSAARKAVNHSLEFLRGYYSDLDECMEWGRYLWVRGPQCFGWHFATGLRHGNRVHTISGLYSSAASAEGFGGWVDSEFEMALSTIDDIDIDFVRPDGTRDTSPMRATNLQRAMKED